ncbi:hypothetical protein GPECTOR_5g283 [Gonium pectorale]|uniref:Cytochrome P450 n=1 Tax=Gonium pectorale TaxID=33097 RepID=A0A150GWY0_GONPE|nr:hypothetical protein GPECTOR_5g283 [Gonium pectorale]|eukprot:KXZ54188.1 hypothetical protein GPECTOR_5g283 [Gonium pectorale]
MQLHVADPILGHVKYLLRPDYHRVVLEWTRKYGGIFRIRLLTDWTVVVTDPAVAGQVLSNIHGRTANYALVDEVLGGPGKTSMFGTPNEAEWRNVRKATAPAFSMSNVRRYYGGVLSAAAELLTALDAAAAGREDESGVAAEPLLQRLMLRATLEGLFEVPDATALPGFDTLAADVSRLMTESNVQITNPPRALWYRWSPVATLLSRHFAECRRALRRTVVFHTATAARILARPDPPPDCSLLVCRDVAVRVGPYALPAGTVVWPILYGIHVSDANWEEAECFRPERWLEDPRCAFVKSEGATDAAAPGSGPATPTAAGAWEEGGAPAAPRRFMPFGEGPKNCVGQNFGITVVRSVVALLLGRYRWALAPDMLTELRGGVERAAGWPVTVEDTARLTQVAVVTKLRRLQLVPRRRE